MLNCPAVLTMPWTLATNMCDQIPLTEARKRGTCVVEMGMIGCLICNMGGRKIYVQEKTAS